MLMDFTNVCLPRSNRGRSTSLPITRPQPSPAAFSCLRRWTVRTSTSRSIRHRPRVLLFHGRKTRRHAIRGALWRDVAGLGPRRSAEASLAAEEEGHAIGEERRAGGILGTDLDDRDRGLALVVDVGDPHLTGDACRRRRQGSVHLDVLLPVQQHERVELEARHVEDVAVRRELHHQRVRRQHLEVLLVSIGEFVRIGRRNAGPDAEVIENDVVVPPRCCAGGELSVRSFMLGFVTGIVACMVFITYYGDRGGDWLMEMGKKMS